LAGNTVESRTFIRETITINSSTRYTNCAFDHCTLVFDGSGFNLDGCSVNGCTWSLTGAAATTLSLLGALWPDPANDGVFQAVFERISSDQKTANGLMVVRKRSR
jgi:hypothetical protein